MCVFVWCLFQCWRDFWKRKEQRTEVICAFLPFSVVLSCPCTTQMSSELFLSWTCWGSHQWGWLNEFHRASGIKLNQYQVNKNGKKNEDYSYFSELRIVYLGSIKTTKTSYNNFESNPLCLCFPLVVMNVITHRCISSANFSLMKGSISSSEMNK